MATSTAITNIRKFFVKGKIDCLFTPDTIEYEIEISNLQVELWQKGPMNIYYLGKAFTDETGQFLVVFELDDASSILQDNTIENVFAKIYYKGKIISGENPYIDDASSAKRPIKNITLREGLTDIGTHSIKITAFEYSSGENFIEIAEKPFDELKRILFDVREFSSKKPLPIGYHCKFTGFIEIDNEDYTLFSTALEVVKEGYVELAVPQLPVIVQQPDQDLIINLKVNGIPEKPSQECYLELELNSKLFYTPITNLIIYKEKLCVFIGEKYYYLKDTPEDLKDVSIISFSPSGQIAYYDSSSETWNSDTGLVFCQFEYPENLTKVSNGIYSSNPSVGVVTTGQLGTGSFAEFSLSVDNPSIFPLNVELKIDAPNNQTIFTGTFANLLPGSRNFVMVETDDFPAQFDDSPTIEDIEIVSGVTFTLDFKNFIKSKQIDTLEKIKKAGPIRYIEGFPSTAITEADLIMLQGHVDLYTVNSNSEQNQHLIDLEFNNLYKISETPKDVFLNIVEDSVLPLFHAAQIHETIVQNQKLVSNLLAAKMSDYELKTSFIPDLPNSTFANTAFSKFINRCECEDCNSAVSPFSYFVDLLKYGAKHINKTGTPSYNPVNYNAFLTLLENYFFQPFGSFAVDCDTLHKEYCRMRLVTEILEQYVITKTLPVEVLERLKNDRKNFILLTYKTLLTQAGTSYEELRNVISIQDEEEQEAAALRLSNKIGIPLYNPDSVADLTAKRMWLTFDNVSPNQELNAENLELIFGFRDTQRDVLTNPPMSAIGTWKEAHLKNLWKSTDYLFSAYSREDVNPTDDNSFKSEWKPIIDPDSFGRGDMTYQSSDFALTLWRHRKADTDTFLSYFVSNNNILSRTSVDIQGRILRVPNKNLDGIQFQNGIVRLKNPIGGLYDVNFGVYSTALNGVNTNIILKKSVLGPPAIPQPDMFQPDGMEPVIRYDSVIQVSQTLTALETTITLNWNNTPVILDNLSNGRVQLISTDSNTEEIYIYDPTQPPSPLQITSVNIISDSEVTLVVTPQLSEAFVARNISFAYEAEVALDTATIPDPEKVCEELFMVNNFDYTYLSPAPTGMTDPFNYTVWDDPGTWPGTTGSGANYYEKLKKLYEAIRSGSTEEAFLSVVTDSLHTDIYGFNLVMELLISCEQYLNSMYSYEKPDTEKLYQMASVFRNSARQKLNENWVKEEIKHIPSGGTDPEELMLNSRYFWKALNEPLAGPWNSSLQTIPDTVGEITASDIPIIDPELVLRQRLLVSPDAEAYRNLYDTRQNQLDTQRTIYFGWLVSVPFNAEGFKHILNHINTGDENTDYNISPYTNLNALILDFESTDVFRQLKANTVLQEAFALTPDAFSAILPVMNAYQDVDPSNQPSIVELRSVTDILVTACKKKRFYFTIGIATGWIEEEITGNFPDGEPVKYYNVLGMRLDSVLGNVLNRSEWQSTLAKWNRVPTVFPDIVPPENIKRFVQGEIVHDLWVSRKNTLDITFNQAYSQFNDTLPVGTLFQNFKNILSMLVARAQIIPTDDFSFYFTDLFEKEIEGEDIRPYLNQLNIQIAEYQVLKQIYTVLQNENGADPLQTSNLLPSEFEDVINISIHVNFANAGGYFSYVKEEYYANIILNGEDFQNFKPAIINFPLNIVTETTEWRSPIADKKAWKDTLNTRIERKQSVLDEWDTVLEKTEDITMPVMRDALIQALRNNCESFENAAERIAKTLFIETKDNCCVKHSRVSHAIDTIQGFIFSLESGIYDNYLSGFTLNAPNFDKEWQWLGSYATWRSAVFTYIYPENLLYPTLKRRQSPAFIELAETIQNANRFTPLNACQAAKKYQEYFEDIQNLKLVCTANANAYIYRKDPLDCCGNLNNSMQEYMTYYFAQSTISGKGYYSEKPYYAIDTNEHDFWKVIPTLRENAKIIGCLPLNREYDDNGQATNLALWLFYTYKEDGEFKLAFLKKDLMTAGSEWTEEEEIELPDVFQLKHGVITNGRRDNANILESSHKLTKITICQNSNEWDFIYFIFSYEGLDAVKRHVQIRFDIQNDFFDLSLGSLLYFDSHTYPVTALQHQIADKHEKLQDIIGITVIFENELQTGYYGSLSGNNPTPPFKKSIENLIGAFKKNLSSIQIIIANRNSVGDTLYTEFHFHYESYNNRSQEVINIIPTGFPLFTPDLIINILYIAPRFNASNWESANAVTMYTKNNLVGVTFVYGTNTLAGHVSFSLAPEKNVESVPIVSGDCIDIFSIRAENIKEHLKGNLNAPQGNPIGSYYRTNTIKEVLYEAYYFVPMLIALDQQQRGDYPTALDWYRSVYDYTNNLSHKRKIFYGLVLEQSITNVFDRPGDWLLDPLNPHLIAQTRTNAYTKYTLMNIIQCMLSYGDREFTIDTIETVPIARKLYTEALGLMKVSELNVKPSQCYSKSHSCFQTAVNSTIDLYWQNSFDDLQNELETLNNVGAIEEASEELVEIFNGNGSMEEKFTSAFTYLANFEVPHEKHDTILELIDGVEERMNDAYRYLFAELSTESFNKSVEGNFTGTLAKLTSQTPQEVVASENVGKLSWLKNSISSNAEPLVYRFIDAEGIQLLNNNVAYNPMHPSPVAFQSNLVFSNAAELYSTVLYEENYVPIVDYAFCLPSNPVYSALELKANLELFKIHNCRNIAGMERSLDIFAAPTDSVTGVPVIGAGGNLILPGTGAITPSQYRFRVLIDRAKQLVAQAQQLESQFLATLEKEDAENYNQLRARQDLQTAKSTVKLQDMRVNQALNEETIADLQLDKMQFVQTNFNNLLAAGLNGYEIASIALLTASAATQGVASGLAYASVNTITDSGSGGTSLLASSLATISSIMSQLASYQRRQQEWQYQSDLAGYDISIANQQIKIAEQNTRIVSQEREIASLNMDHATDTLEFLKTKFTNAELYRWMGNVLERAYSYMLSLATAVAKMAEQQYYFEQQEQVGPFIMDDYWEVPQTGTLALTGGGGDRRGLTGSARLLQDITKLDQYAFETTKRKLQMTKVISLGQLYPDAFQTFRETGVLNFDLTNRLFDYDFPGHYLRLINGVKVSVVGLIPVYDNIKATLTAGTTSYTVINANNTFQQVPIRRMEVDQVALTGASRATGVFEFQAAQGELLNPFEGMGVESRWEFKMPRFSNRMDYSTIADVLIEVDYTALDSFQYRYQVLQEIDNTLGFSRGFSFKNDYPDQWYELAEVQEGGTEFSVEIELKRDQFPQGIENIHLDGSNLLLHFVRKDGFTEEIVIQRFTLASDTSEQVDSGGDTNNGTFKAVYLTNLLNAQTPASPFVKLRLAFANTTLNRELFSMEQVTDILLLVSCKADLPVYPL